MRVLVTGSRQFRDRDAVYGELSALYASMAEGEDFTVVHGAAPGADALANDWCWDNRHLSNLVGAEPHPANWKRGNIAGRTRNVEMVRLGADQVLAFFAAGAQNAGTRNCVEEAQHWIPSTPIKEVWR